MRVHQTRIMAIYNRVHFWVNLPGENDFADNNWTPNFWRPSGDPLGPVMSEALTRTFGPSDGSKREKRAVCKSELGRLALTGHPS